MTRSICVDSCCPFVPLQVRPGRRWLPQIQVRSVCFCLSLFSLSSLFLLSVISAAEPHTHQTPTHTRSVDELFHVPHFEKMLYDNPQLVRLSWCLSLFCSVLFVPGVWCLCLFACFSPSVFDSTNLVSAPLAVPGVHQRLPADRLEVCCRRGSFSLLCGTWSVRLPATRHDLTRGWSVLCRGALGLKSLLSSRLFVFLPILCLHTPACQSPTSCQVLNKSLHMRMNHRMLTAWTRPQTRRAKAISTCGRKR